MKYTKENPTNTTQYFFPQNSFEASVITNLTGFLRHKITAFLRDIDRGLHGLVVTLFLSGLELAASGGAVLPWVLVAIGISNKSEFCKN